MRRILIIGIIAIVAMAIGGLFAFREVAQSSHAVGAAPLMSQEQSDLELTKTHTNEPMIAGSLATYTVIVHNAGPQAARGVVIVDIVPPDKVVQGVVEDPPGSGLYWLNPPVGGLDVNMDTIPDWPCAWYAVYPNLYPPPPYLYNVVACYVAGASSPQIPAALPELLPSQSVKLVVPVIPDLSSAGKQNVNHATVELLGLPYVPEPDPTVDPNPANNSADDIANVAPASVDITKDGPGLALTGNPVQYTINIHSTGPSPATDVVVTDVLPPEVTFVGVSASCDTAAIACAYDDPSRTVTCNVTGVIPVCETCTITIDTTCSAPGTTVNSAEVCWADPLCNQSNEVETIQLPTEPHYACYMAAGLDPPGGVSLETQFGVELRVEVGRGTRLCAPAIKNGEGTLDHTHLRWFAIDEPAPNRVVNIFTQFGEFDNVLLGNAAALLAPTSKEVVVPPGGGSYQRTEEPHYKCYSAGATHAIASATVQDQFYPQGIGWNVGDLQALCLPAGKDGAPIPEAPDLACFISVRDASLSPHTVNLETQFGAETGIALPPTMISTLCVPAMKEVVGPNYDCRPTASPGYQVDPPPVRLETQFGVEEHADPYPPLMGELLCAPALKNGEGNTQAAHLRSFNLWDEPPLDPPPVVNLTTQFGELNNVVVSVGGYAPWLLAPASKTEPPSEPPTPPAEPHYKCYNISGPSVGPTVLVESQFTPVGGEAMYVGGPAMLCLPAGKNGAPIPDAPHLVCYVTFQPGTIHSYWVRTQFGFEELWVGGGTPTFLCVPAEKELACIDRLGDTACDDPVNDFDDDGCADAEEQAGAPAPKPGATGAYNPAAWYDFYDVPIPAKPDALGANGTRNRAVNLQDVVGVLKYVGTSVNGAQNSNGVDYDTIKGVDLNGDTTNDILPPLHPIPEGQKYDRSPSPAPNPPFDAGPPDGFVNLQDVVVVLKQVGLACTGVP